MGDNALRFGKYLDTSGPLSDTCIDMAIVYYYKAATHMQSIGQFNITTVVSNSGSSADSGFTISQTSVMTVTVTSGPPGGSLELIGQYTGQVSGSPSVTVSLGTETTGAMVTPQEQWMRYTKFIRANIGESVTIAMTSGAWLQIHALSFNVYPY